VTQGLKLHSWYNNITECC